MEIERKFLVKALPDLTGCRSKKITQAYVSIDPVIRIRQMNEDYYLTVKSKGAVAREEFEMPITRQQYEHLCSKIEGCAIEKMRSYVPLDSSYTAELDIYSGSLNGLVTVEVEFPSMAAADRFVPPDWFGKDISTDNRYKNNRLAKDGMPVD